MQRECQHTNAVEDEGYVMDTEVDTDSVIVTAYYCPDCGETFYIQEDADE